MNKRLEDLFNMTADKLDSEEITTPNEKMEDIKQQQIELFQDFDELDKIDSALPGISDFDTDTDKELDELADKAMEGYNTLIDIAGQAELRFAGPIYEAATKMIGHAISAKTNKIRKKLDIVNLQIRKAKLDRDHKITGNKSNHIESTGTVIDRNELLAMIQEKIK